MRLHHLSQRNSRAPLGNFKTRLGEEMLTKYILMYRTFPSLCPILHGYLLQVECECAVAWATAWT